MNSQGFNRLASRAWQGVVNAWDWPLVRGNEYSSELRREFRSLSTHFSRVAGVSIGVYATTAGVPILTTLGLTATGVFAARYFAGAVVAIQHHFRPR